MNLRIAQVNCFIDQHDRPAKELLDAWSALPMVAEAAADAGAEVHVVQSARHREIYCRNGVTYHFVRELRLRGGSGPGLMPWRVAAQIRRILPDVIHFHGFESPAHLRAAGTIDRPVLVQDHASSPRRRAKWLRSWSLKNVDACAFTSCEQALPFIAAGHLPPHVRIFDITESTTHFRPGSRQAARAKTGVFGNPAVLWVGHLNRNKDPLTILRAMSEALAGLPDMHLWCAFGSAELMSEVNALLAEDKQLRDHVHLLGRVSHKEVQTLCQASDIFVSGSHRESCGFALLEALACGLTPVVSDIPSYRRITGDGAVGVLVPSGDVSGFAHALLMQGRTINSESRAYALAHFGAHLSTAALGRQLLHVYGTLAGGHVAAGRDRLSD